jgi:hypothetical protein
LHEALLARAAVKRSTGKGLALYANFIQIGKIVVMEFASKSGCYPLVQQGHLQPLNAPISGFRR